MKTVGKVVEEVKQAWPAAVSVGGFRLRYLGEVTVEEDGSWTLVDWRGDE